MLTETRTWRDPENRQLAEIQERDGRFGIGPITINSLDRMGLNYLEIITLSQLVGTQLGKMTTADCDFLNDLEEQYGIEFVTEYKTKVNQKKLKLVSYFRKRLDHVCSNKRGELWLTVTSLVKV